MNIFRETESLRHFLHHKRELQTQIGLVPTMGALHQGHMALIRASKAENAITVCSIYVNPTQFNDPKDLDNYPSTESADLILLEAEQCDVVFIPSHDEMYAIFNNLKLSFGNLDKILEGKFRPEHFNGVALVVAKLFNIVQPDLAYFGQKDYQQFKVISCLIEELKFPLNLRCVSTARASDGLALSSRNTRLTSEERKSALSFFNMLVFAKKEIEKGIKFSHIREEAQHQFAAMKAVSIEYFELAHCESLELLEDVASLERAVILIAGRVGNVRLIDNMIVHSQ